MENDRAFPPDRNEIGVQTESILVYLLTLKAGQFQDFNVSRRLPLLQFALMGLIAISLPGCGVTKLWGGEDTLVDETTRPGLSLREQASEISKTAWSVEEKGSFMSQMAGVLVNGARSAGEALDVFDWTENESSETRQAKEYIAEVKKTRRRKLCFR